MKKLFLSAWLMVAVFAGVFAQNDLREESIYFLITSRFYDGDTSNNVPNEWCSYIPGVTNQITDPRDVTWRGDFRGLIQKLDYIKNMGFTAIWITPVVHNRSPLDYHGYHAWDFTKVDPRLESPGATFQDLINAVHAKGMKLFLDIVTNHSGRYGIKGISELKYNTDPTKPWGQDLNGQPLADNPNWQYDGLTRNPLDNKIWSRSNLAKMPPPYNANLANYNFPCTQSFVNTSDSNFFHQSGNGFVQGWDDTTNCYQRAVADDCPDLHTGSTPLRDYLFNAYKRYIDMGVDGVRWDTWKHMNKYDIIHLLDRWRAIKPDLIVFGEVAQKRFELHPVLELNPHWYTWRGAVGSSASLNVGVLDFYGEATFHNIFENGGAFSGVTDAARYDNLYADPSLLVTWLDNHDFGPNNDWNRRYGGSVENLAACMNFMFTWRGTPAVYYGTEMQFKKGYFCDINEPSSINRSLDTTGRAYYGNNVNTAVNHVMYKHIAKLNAIRKAIPALQKGSWQWAGNYPGNGIGFTRTYNGQVVAVGLAKDGNASFNFTGLTNGIYRDAVTGREINVTAGTLQFSVASLSAGIYVLNGPGMIGESGAGFFEPCINGCIPSPRVAISPESNNYAAPLSVSITASGGTPPYTIFYTTNGSTPTTASTVYSAPFNISTATTVKAIVRDANNKISEVAAQIYTFVLPTPVVQITPASGNYYNPVSVSLSATSGTAPYSIYYTIDGSTPTSSSTLYTTPFIVSAPSTVKAIATDANAITSAVKSASYTFNIPAPVISASPSGGNYPTPPVAVSLSANSPRPPVTMYYTTDGTTPTLSSSVYSAPIALNGPNAVTLKYIGRDNEGRVSSADSQRYTFNPIPDFWVYFKKPANWGSQIRIYYWNLLPLGAMPSVSWPGVAMTQECPGGLWWKFKFSGTTSVNIIFTDGASQTPDLVNITGTRYYDNGWLSVIPDITKPTASFTVNPSSGTAPLTVAVNASASTGCTNLTYFWDFANGNTDNATFTSATTYVNPGTYSIRLIVKDQTGKTDTTFRTVTVNAAPTGMTIHFRRPAAWLNIPRLYFWNTQPSGPSTTWPGVNMIEEGNGWWKYTISGVNCSNFIFNNNSSPQTNDLYNCGECWYDNGFVSNPVTGLPSLGSANSILIFPNPVQNSLYLLNKKLPFGLYRISLINTLGDEKFAGYYRLLPDATLSLDVRRLSGGMYFLMVRDKNGSLQLTRQVMIVR